MRREEPVLSRLRAMKDAMIAAASGLTAAS